MQSDAENSRTLTEHAVTLGVLVKSVSSIEAFMRESVESQKKQERLMERLANFEGNTASAFDRAHIRIDSMQKQLDSHEEACENKCNIISPKAEAGHRAYLGLVWALCTIGALAIGTLYTKIWG